MENQGSLALTIRQKRNEWRMGPLAGHAGAKPRGSEVRVTRGIGCGRVCGSDAQAQTQCVLRYSTRLSQAALRLAPTRFVRGDGSTLLSLIQVVTPAGKFLRFESGVPRRAL